MRGKVWDRRRILAGVPAVALAIAAGCAAPPEPKPPYEPVQFLDLYTVQPGETMYDLAERRFQDRSLAWALTLVNELPEPESLAPGTVIFIPTQRDMLVSMAEHREPAKRFYNRGTYLLEQGREEDAIAEFERALRECPEVVTPQYHLGLAHLRRGDAGKALPLLAEVARLRPLDADFRYALGCAHLLGGDASEALKEFEQAGCLDPGLRAALYGKALALERMGKKKDAAGAWRAYLQVDGSGEWAEAARRHLVDLYAED